ncbi:MAG: MAPEG family protein [Pseudomonadota bacterium]
MTPDLIVLALAALLAIVQLFLFALPANLELGVKYTAGPRDDPMAGLRTTTARLKRAYENFLETLPLFAIAVIVTHVTEQADGATAAASWAYLAARVLYIPAYLSGVFMLRSAIWGVSLLAIVVILIRALL